LAGQEDEFDTERLKIRVFIGERSTVVTFENIDVDHVLSDSVARGKIEQQIRTALDDRPR